MSLKRLSLDIDGYKLMNKAPLEKRRKIVAISTSYPIRAESVSGIFVHRLYAALAKSWDLLVLCPGDAMDDSLGSFDGVSIIPVRYAPQKWQVLGGAGGLIPSIKNSPFKLVLLPILLISIFFTALIKSKSATIIHANWAVSGAIAVVVGKIRRIPVVTTLRGDDIARAKDSFLDKVLLKLAVLGSAKIICVSKAMADQLMLKFPVRKADISACLNGVDESFLKIQHIKNKIGVLRIVSVGSLIPRKGYDLLIQAVASIKHKYPVQVVIAGDGPSRLELIKQAELLGVAANFDFVGELSQFEVQKLLSNSDVFILSSRSEGRPNVVVEAMAAGLPIISSELDGVQDLVIDGHNGWKFKTGNAADLARAIEKATQFLDDLYQWGAISRLLLGNSSNWEFTAQQYTEVFFAALSDKSKSGLESV
jgi:glycosyltransferase involved in cell wall biosynthesis